MSASTDASFRDRVVLLAGATGKLGALVARRLHEGGCRLALTVRRAWQVERVRAAFGTGVLVGVVPATDAEAAAGFVKGARDALGPIDALIVTVGASTRAEVGKDTSGLAQEMLEANYLAPATLSRAVVPPMRRRNAGTLVLVGSDTSEPLPPGFAHYFASKAALRTFARCLQVELSGTAVRVALVPPPLVSEGEAALQRAADRILAAALGSTPLYPPERGG